MGDQLGRHDASGPLRRRPDGTVDPDGYWKAQLGGRSALAIRAAYLLAWGLLLLARTVQLTTAVALLVGVLVLDVLMVCAVRAVESGRERRRRAAGSPPSWPATLMVMQARAAGFQFPASVRSNMELRGRLEHGADGWVWTATPSRHLTPLPDLALGSDPAPQIIRRTTAHALLSFHTGEPTRLDFWVAHPRDLGQYLSASLPPVTRA